MNASHTASRTKNLAAIVLLVALAAVCLAAARWQLNRASQREAIAAAIEAGRTAPPLTLDATHREGADWHPAQASGHWLNEFTVLLDNRNLNGAPGLWVATPLALATSPQTALLVLRGWVARPLPPAQLPDLRGPEGTLDIRGTILSRVPRLFDLGSLTGHLDTALPSTWPAAAIPRVQNLALADLQRATGLNLLPVILEQSQGADTPLVQEWPGPSINASQNYNYAAQWFAFATIALVAAGVVGWRWRHPRRTPTSPADPAST